MTKSSSAAFYASSQPRSRSFFARAELTPADLILRSGSWRKHNVMSANFSNSQSLIRILEMASQDAQQSLSSVMGQVAIQAMGDMMINLHTHLIRLSPDSNDLVIAGRMMDSVFHPYQQFLEASICYAKLTQSEASPPASYLKEYYEALSSHSGDFTPIDLKSARKVAKEMAGKKPKHFSQQRPPNFKSRFRGSDTRSPFPRRGSSPHHPNSRSRSRSKSPEKP